VAVEEVETGPKTIADFRKENGPATKRVCREFTLLCKQLDLIGGELVAIDASRFQTVNGEKRNFTAAKLERQIEEIDAKIEAYLDQLESRGLLTRGQLRRQTTEIYQSCWRAEAG
jgi:hypothetical protein